MTDISDEDRATLQALSLEINAFARRALGTPRTPRASRPRTCYGCGGVVIKTRSDATSVREWHRGYHFGCKPGDAR
jgi:hypothetical protein